MNEHGHILSARCGFAIHRDPQLIRPPPIKRVVIKPAAWRADTVDMASTPSMQLAQRERRQAARDARPGQASVQFLDGPLAGQTLSPQTRDQSYRGASFILPVPVALGGTCRIHLAYPDGVFATFVARVVRCTPCDTGHQVAVEFRRQMAA